MPNPYPYYRSLNERLVRIPLTGARPPLGPVVRVARGRPWQIIRPRVRQPCFRPYTPITNIMLYARAMREPSAECFPDTDTNEYDFAATELAAEQAALLRGVPSGSARSSSNSLGTHHPLNVQIDGTVPPAATSPVEPTSSEDGQSQLGRRTQSVPALDEYHRSLNAHFRTQHDRTQEAQQAQVDGAVASTLAPPAPSPPLPPSSSFPSLDYFNRNGWRHMLDTIENRPKPPPAPPPSNAEANPLVRTTPGGTQYPIHPPSSVDLTQALQNATADSTQPSPERGVVLTTTELTAQYDSDAEGSSEPGRSPSPGLSMPTAGPSSSRRARQVDDSDADADDESSRPPNRARLSGGPIPWVGRDWIPADGAGIDPLGEGESSGQLSQPHQFGGPDPQLARYWLPGNEESRARAGSSCRGRIRGADALRRWIAENERSSTSAITQTDPPLELAAADRGRQRTCDTSQPPANTETGNSLELPATDRGRQQAGDLPQIPYRSEEDDSGPSDPSRSSSSWINVSDREGYSDVSMSWRLSHGDTNTLEFLENARGASMENDDPLRIRTESEAE